MCLYDCLGDGEPKAYISSPLISNLPIPVEYTREISRRDARTLIRDREGDEAIAAEPRRDENSARGGTELDRVSQQVREDLQYAPTIDIQLRQIWRNIGDERDLFHPGQCVDRLDRLLYERGNNFATPA